MRTYKERRFLAGISNLAENVNREFTSLNQQFNQQLDMHNLPLEGFDEGKFELSTYAVGTGITQSSFGEINNFHRTAPQGSVLTYDLVTGSVFRGWNVLDPVLKLQFTSLGGMIKGAAEINVEHKATYDTLEAISFEVDNTGYVELGVFCNNILVGHSGKIPNGTHSIDLPFTFPVGEEPVEITVKYRVYVYYSSTAGVAWDSNDLIFRDRTIWARNQTL